jgi:hypothetical protein
MKHQCNGLIQARGAESERTGCMRWIQALGSIQLMSGGTGRLGGIADERGKRKTVSGGRDKVRDQDLVGER